MPKFLVHLLRDAYVQYTIVVEADSAEEAGAIADSKSYEGRLKRGDVLEYDDIIVAEGETELIEGGPADA
jgi:hypothetical protein